MKERCIHLIPFKATSHNTLTEADAVVSFAKISHLEFLILIAPPFHMTRAFMTTIRMVELNYSNLKVYSYPGIPLDWMESAVHSQGNLKDLRKNFIKAELDRINLYYRKGDLISYSELLDYLNRRDGKQKNAKINKIASRF
jgi:hypothetical protein